MSTFSITLIILVYILCVIGFKFIISIATNYNKKLYKTLWVLSIIWPIMLIVFGFGHLMIEIEIFLKT